MKLKIIIINLLFVAVFLSCKKDESLTVGNVGNTEALLLSQVLIDNQPSFGYLYNAARLISEEKSTFNFTMYHYNDKNQLVTTDYYSNYDILSSDLTIFQTALNRKEWVTPDSPNKGGNIKYEYSDNGQLFKATYSPLSGSSQYSEFSYGVNNRISRQILYWADKETGSIEYSYDGKGNLSEENLYNLLSTGVNELGTTVRYEFDNEQNPYKSVSKLMTPGINTNRNNIIKETYTIHLKADQGADKTQITPTSYVYNEKGYPISKNGNVTFVYK